MDKLVKIFNGHSGSLVMLMQTDTNMYILKTGNVERNFKQLTALKNIVNVPKIFEKKDDKLKMEYIHGIDIKNYLIYNNSNNLLDFIIESISIFSKNSIEKDYTEIYNKKLAWLDDSNEFLFTKKELIEKLPKILPASLYHGDMTLENIIYKNDGNFYFIDPVSIEYDSWVFDIAKLRQDLECKWFLRKNPVKIDVKLNEIQNKILKKFPIANNNYLLIIMLLRVFLHCKKYSDEYFFIKNEVNKLWK